MDLSHHALSSRNGGRAGRRDPILAGGRRDVARVARILSRFNRDAQPRSGLLLRGGPDAAPPRLSREYRGWICRRAADLGLRDGERYSPADPAPCLPAWSRPPADPGNADRVDRYQRGPVRVTTRHISSIKELIRPVRFGGDLPASSRLRSLCMSSQSAP